ncbi:MAG: hypothetical protein FJ109_21945 [Deltaproteobacteria bacterium]|nr:hypothetical protein [Deltaproteobacteria bacterium]
MDGETLVETREKALREWLLRRILAGDAIREAFLSKEQIALLLVAAGVAAMPPEPLSDHSANEDSDDEPRDPSIGGRDAKDEALDMVAYDVQVLRGTAKNKSARKRWKSPNTIS